MYTLTRRECELYKIARDAGYTPRELSLTHIGGHTYTLEAEELLPNAIAECYTGRERAEKILVALSELHDLGVQPYIDQNEVCFLNGSVVFLTVDYTKAYGEFNPKNYKDLMSALTSTTHEKVISSGSNEAAIYQEMAEIGVAPEVIQVTKLGEGKYLMVTHRYPYSLSDAAHNGVRLSEEAKRDLVARMQAMHEHGILHADVTEENFVCNLAGDEAYIIDFGLSVRTSSASNDWLVEYILDCESSEDVDASGNRMQLIALATQVELEKLVRLLEHF